MMYKDTSKKPIQLQIKPSTEKKKISLKIKDSGSLIEKTEIEELVVMLKPTKILLPHGQSWVEIFEHIPEKIQMNKIIFERIWNQHPSNYAEGFMFGREMAFPRWDQSYGQDYTYSGKIHKSVPIEDDYLVAVIEWVCFHSGKKYKSMLINWYQDGNHYIGPHSDLEKNIVKNSSIYSFSYGQDRDFVIISKDKTYKKKICMTDGSLIIMAGEMQKYYKHCVPKRSISTCPGRRINITFRLFDN